MSKTDKTKPKCTLLPDGTRVYVYRRNGKLVRVKRPSREGRRKMATKTTNSQPPECPIEKMVVMAERSNFGKPVKKLKPTVEYTAMFDSMSADELDAYRGNIEFGLWFFTKLQEVEGIQSVHLSTQQLARVCNCSEQTIKDITAKAAKKITVQMTGYDVNDILRCQQ